MSNIRQIIIDRYARNRQEMAERGLLLDDYPPVEEVSESAWDVDVDYVERLRGAHTFAFVDLGDESGVELGSVAFWQGIFADDPDAKVRLATEAEVIDFIMSGGIEAAKLNDEAFQQGWDAY